MLKRNITLFIAGVLAICSSRALAENMNHCGVLVRHLACLNFQPDGSTNFYALTPPAVGFFQGDRVWVRGEIAVCANACIVVVGCVLQANTVACPPPPVCRADFDNSGSLGVQDIFSFLAAYFSGVLGASPPGGDFDQNGSVTVNDIFTFLAAYFTGCP